MPHSLLRIGWTSVCKPCALHKPNRLGTSSKGGEVFLGICRGRSVPKWVGKSQKKSFTRLVLRLVGLKPRFLRNPNSAVTQLWLKVPGARLELARPKTGDFKTSATPFIPIYSDPATVGVCAETVAGAAFAKKSTSGEYGLRRARDAGAYGYLYGYLDRLKQSAAEPFDLDPQRNSVTTRVEFPASK